MDGHIILTPYLKIFGWAGYVKTPRDKPLFSERNGYGDKPILRLLGCRLWVKRIPKKRHLLTLVRPVATINQQ